ncbi:MAG: transcriptional repressor [Chloroflexaceae bacterium]|nr:transcriptional repressor [Chloroflexaceae bacterium]NJL34534.1 transcriptional repressor [Chloroflexaceae bacterium]NJO06701.1 transcriptional repressor [Chloroflexaceae bacterium]
MAHSLADVLRQRGHRITPQREMILDAIANHGEHITAEEVLDVVHIRSQAVNIATIYRTLDFLAQEGLVTRTSFENGRLIYTTHRHGPHIHLVCRSCQQVFEISSDKLADLAGIIAAETGFHIDMHHGSLAGWCAECHIQAATLHTDT